jgi:hypothetical protein
MSSAHQLGRRIRRVSRPATSRARRTRVRRTRRKPRCRIRLAKPARRTQRRTSSKPRRGTTPQARPVGFVTSSAGRVPHRESEHLAEFRQTRPTELRKDPPSSGQWPPIPSAVSIIRSPGPVQSPSTRSSASPGRRSAERGGGSWTAPDSTAPLVSYSRQSHKSHVFVRTMLHVYRTNHLDATKCLVPHIFSWLSRLGSNQRPSACEAEFRLTPMCFRWSSR